MPTGYTHKVQDGTITDFPEFALQCARAFGACILMRDDPPETPIPDEFKPDTHHVTALAKAKSDLTNFLSLNRADLRALHATEEQDRLTAYRDQLLRVGEERDRYNSMLEKVKAWKPPTPEHEGLKKFMLEQLSESIKFDCSHQEFEAVDYTPWFNKKLEGLNWSVAYHEKGIQEEKERAANRTAWVRKLRESL